MTPCAKCGEDHQDRCKGHVKSGPRKGLRCTLWPIHGATVCHKHGASAGQVKRAAGRKLAAEQWERSVAELVEAHGRPEIHPLEGLLEVVDRSGAMVGVIGGLVGALAPVRQKPTEDGTETPALYGPDHLGDARPHVLAAMYRDWLETYGRACKLALDAGIDERRVRLAEADAQRLFGAVGRAFDRIDLTTEQREALVDALVLELRALAA